MIFNPIGCLFLFFFPFFICTVCLPCCAVRSGPCKAELQASLLKLPAAPCALRYASVSSPVARYRAALQRPPNSNMKRLRSIIGLNVLWKYCLALCLFSLPLSHSFSPLFPSVASNSSHMFRHCQACGEVHSSNGSFAQIPLLHCLVFVDTREERCVYFFFLVGLNVFILVLIIF